MKRRIISAGLTILFSLTSAWAADVDGKWTAKAGGQGQGGADITLVFKIVDNKLTGTVSNSLSPGDAEIKDGKVTGDEISFSIQRTINGTEATVTWNGRISGDEIKFTRKQEGARGAAATEIVAKRVK